MTTANLTLQDTQAVDQYTSGGESTFAFTFPVLAAAELKVSVDGALQTYGVDYTIDPDSLEEPAGGSITFGSAVTAGKLVTLWLDMPIERLSGFAAGAATLLPEDLNADAVNGLRIAQQLRRDLGRSIRLAVDDPLGGQDMQLLPADSRKGKLLYFSASTGAMELLALADVDGISQALTQSLIVGLLYPEEVGETGVVNLLYPRGCVLRYGNNATPGTTDMSTAFQNAALSSLAPWVPQGVYKITTATPLRDNQHWRMQGADIRISGTTAQVFTVAAGIDDWSIRGTWSVTGDNGDAGATSGSAAAIVIVDSERWYLDAPLAKNISGWGVLVQPGSSTSDRAEHGVIDSPQCFACYVGVEVQAGTGAEYVTIKGPNISRCQTGMTVAAGNVNVVGGTITDNVDNVRLNGGPNNGHGGFHGTQINHAGQYNVRAHDVTNGHTFDGCHFYEGSIWLDNCKGVVFSGGHMDPGSIYNDTGDDSGYNYIRDAWWPGGYTTAITSTNSGEHELILLGNYGPGAYQSGLTINTAAPVYVWVERGTDLQTLATGVAETVIFPYEASISDRRKCYNHETGVATIPAGMAGMYRVSGTIVANSDGGAFTPAQCFLALNVNTSGVRLFLGQAYGAGTDKMVFPFLAELHLEAADTVEMALTLTGTGTLTVGDATWVSTLSIERIA